jgi:SAM-dependent methyltransferase
MPFMCPKTGAPLQWSASALTDASGRIVYPVIHGVPILAIDAGVSRADDAVDPGFVNDLLTLTPDRSSPALRDGIADAFAHRFSFRDPWLASEADQFIDRLRSSGLALRDPYPRKAVTEAPRSAAPCGLEPVMAPKRVLIGKRATFNIQVRNGLRETLPARGADAAFLLVEADDKTSKPTGWRALLAKVSKTSAQTELLVDMAAGRTMAQPVSLPVLHATGPTPVTVKLMRGERELARTRFTIDVVEGADPLQVDWPQGDTVRDYVADHKLAFDVMVGWLGKHIATPDPFVVEVGGNFGPMTYWWPGRRCNLDIDPYGLMAHALMHGAAAPKPEGFVNALGDGMKLPFKDGSVDAIVMFATFHHFPDPVGFLASLKPKLSEGGLIMLFCEPMGHVFRANAPEDFIRELGHGAYEQSFLLWEYRDFFDAAGLEVVDTHIDYGSLKVALRPRVA